MATGSVLPAADQHARNQQHDQRGGNDQEDLHPAWQARQGSLLGPTAW